MIKRIILLVLVYTLLNFSSYTFAEEAVISVEGGGCPFGVCNDTDGNVISLEEAAKQGFVQSVDDITDSAIEAAEEAKAAGEAKAAHEKDCKDGDKKGNCIEKSNFIINVNDISPGMNVGKNEDGTDRTTTENINFIFGTIIQKLMIALGSLSLLIMTVGAGYIVMHSGQDELLSKGKSIFMSGVYALIVALGSYYLVVIFRYLLFN